MATDVERLAVLIEANTRGYENAMKKLQSQTDRALKGVDKQYRDAGRRLESTFAGIGSTFTRTLGALGLGIGSAQSLRAIAAASQEYVKLKNSLRVTGLEGEGLESTLGDLFQIAQRHGTELSPLTTLYARATQAQKELGASSQDLMRFTDGVSLALRVAGTDSQQASGALLQLSQALGSGVVRAEEFNSVNEGARPILQAVAAGLEDAGGSVAKLKTLVTEGKVSSEAFFRAFLAGMPQLEQQASKASGTVGQATARMANAFTVFVGKLDETLGASSNLAGNLGGLASAIEKLPGALTAAGGGLDTLKRKLTEIGNLPVWEKLARLTGATFSDDEVRGLGLDVIPPAGTEDARESARAQAFSSLPKPTDAARTVSLADFAVPGKESPAAKVAKDIKAAADATEDFSLALEQAPLEDFARDAANVSMNMQHATVSGLFAFEDALAGVVTGTVSAKEAFRDLANSIIADLIRIAVRASITGPIAALLGGSSPLGGMMAFGGFRAAGGPVNANEAHVIGERGPEIFVPKVSGSVVPNHKIGGGRPIVVNIATTNHFSPTIGPADQARIEAQIFQASRQTQEQVPGLVRQALYNDPTAIGGA